MRVCNQSTHTRTGHRPKLVLHQLARSISHGHAQTPDQHPNQRRQEPALQRPLFPGGPEAALFAVGALHLVAVIVM